MKTIEQIVVFLCAYLFCGWGTWFVQEAKADVDAGQLRVFAYGLRYEYKEPEGTILGTYRFYFKSNLEAKEGWLIFYNDQDGDDNRNESGTEVGRYKIPNDSLTQKNDKGEHSFSLSKSQIPVDVTEHRAYKNMTWAIELKNDKIIGKYPEATEWLDFKKHQEGYNYRSYINAEGNTTGGSLYKQVQEPRRLMEDCNLQWPQGVAIDNNPQSPYFGRVYIANTLAPAGIGDPLSSDMHRDGVLVYEPDPVTGTYKMIAEGLLGSRYPFPVPPDQNSRYYMHRIAVNPVNGYVYLCQSTSNAASAIYQITPNADGLDEESMVNVTEKLLPPSGDFRSSPLHPINSLTFGPGGELYVMSHAKKANDQDANTCGAGTIYKLTKSDGDDLYDGYEQYYTPRTEPQTVAKTGTKKGEPYMINPWVDADNTMVVNARGGFWVSQKRYGGIDKYAFLAHIHPDGYVEKSKYGTGLNQHFQFAMSTVEEETFSALSVTPKWIMRQLLAPHKPDAEIEETFPTGQVAIYEKGGLNSEEAMLAVGFKGKVCVFKLFYNDNHETWFGFNQDWMFEIPIGDQNTTIDGLAFDYAGNLFIVSGSRHKLYLYSLPNYDAMDTDHDPAVQPLTFNQDGGRLTEFTNGNQTTNASNNLNRGKPMDDNSIAVPAKYNLVVDGAIVYDEAYNSPNFDEQWSTTDNWNIKATPTLEDYPVVIRSNAIIDEAQQAGGLIMENNSQLTITHEGGLTIGSNSIIGEKEDGSSVVVQNYSTIHQDTKPQGAGYLRIHPSVKEEDMPIVTVDYHTKSQPSEMAEATDNDRLWQYVGAPGKGTKVEVKKGETWLYQWSDQWGWMQLPSWQQPEGTVELQPFVGYTITQEGHPIYTWTTTPINQSKDIALEYAGWGDNIFTNSYLAPINIAKFTADDFTGDMLKTFYLFNTGSWNEWQGAFDEANGVLTTTQAPGQYTAIPVLSAENINENSDPTTIAPMQGVYVVANEAGCQLHLDYERLVWNTANPGNKPMTMPERKSTEDHLMRRIRIQAYGKNSGSDRMYILQDMRCTPGYDNGYDGLNMNASGQVNIYTNEPCGSMEISASNQIDSMYIGFCAGPDTTYTLRFTSLIGEDLYIKDLATDSIIALAEEGEYTFQAPAKSVNDMRFQVLLNPDLPNTAPDENGVTTDTENISNGSIWITNNYICIATGTPNQHTVVYHVNGQEVMNKHFNYQTTLPIQHLGTGVYVVRVNDDVYKFVKQD